MQQEQARKRPRHAFPEQLRRDRMKMGLTQVSAAAKMGVSYSSIQKWESGRAVPDEDQRRILCDFFSWEGLYIVVDSGPTDTRPGSSVLPDWAMEIAADGLALAQAS